ncbi:GHKL domain-containing protein [Macrococcus brunensis]|uniref:GHKL domain-containing protein n=1 Tax=Macrococcus brunensis TaxID=198483 RepID=A0A4V3BD75_9STAP|nr:GHKL domain-containing protein [Macrococcus brunensis]TDL95257.1 GHKL domain-containing protein [Macrococcus brunensis]ULG74468.1 GHKL domain-containing protein [Macrococcus brunensis]
MYDFNTSESVIFIIFQCICFSIAVTLLGNFKYSRKGILYTVLLFIVPAVILFFVFRTLAILYFIVFYTFFYRRRSFLVNGLIVLITIFISVISDHLAALITISIFGENFFYNDRYVLYFVMFLSLMVVLPWLIRTIFNKVKDFQVLYSHNRLLVLLLVGYLAISILLIYLIIPDRTLTEREYVIYASFYIIYFIISFGLIVLVARAYYQKLLLSIKSKENEDYYKYTKELEKNNNVMRKFKHDYVNILSTMSGYIYNDDMEGLKVYFSDYIVPLKENIDNQQYQLYGMNRINAAPLKGILTSKMIETQEQNISLKVDVSDEINSEDIQMDIIDYTRMIGIVWDNAIEASLEIEKSEIQAALMKTEESLLFVISNHCKPDMPPIATLYEENFTTKNGQGGIGLANLAAISAKYTNLFLDTSIQSNLFIQKIEVLFVEER